MGRIAAIHDERHNEFHEESTGFFGFFECIDDQEVANLMLETAGAWLKDRGLKNLRGPANPSFNHTVGLQVSAFDRKPYIMMTQNPPYYEKLIEGFGLKNAKELLAFEMMYRDGFPKRMTRLAERLKKKNRVTFRYMDLKRFDEEVNLIRDLYNSAWEKNWGFVPMDDDEFDHMAKGLKDVLWKEFCIIAEREGEPIGFILSLPDINQILASNRNGRLIPFGLIKLLLGLRPKKKGSVSRVRVATLGVKPEFRTTGVANLLCLETFNSAAKMNVEGGEMSWVLEDNKDMVNAAELMSGEGPYKRYRVYDKSLQ